MEAGSQNPSDEMRAIAPRPPAPLGSALEYGREDVGAGTDAGLATAGAHRLLDDALAGLTVALVAIPQCVGFAIVAGLPPASGLITAVVMGLVCAAVSQSPRLVIGPAITASTMLLAVLRSVAPDDPAKWQGIAAILAVLVGAMTLVGALIGVGRLARFVSRSVVVGLIAGSVMLTLGSQLAPVLGLPSGTRPMLVGILWHTLSRIGEANAASVTMAAGTCVFVLAGSRAGSRFPAAFVALLLSGTAAWILEMRGAAAGLHSLAAMTWQRPMAPAISFAFGGPNLTDLLAGAAAISVVGIIQNVAIGKALGSRGNAPFDTRRELWTLGLANVASGLASGFPGSGSFARSALADLAGARTRLASLVAAVATGAIALLAAPLMHYVTAPAIGGLLIATAISMVDWSELRHLVRDVHDRPVLATMVVCVFFLPIHWAILIGLVVSIVVLLRRVSRVHVFEMVRSAAGPFREQEIDEQTGRSAITMIQLEGPLFFAHADQLAGLLRQIMRRGPRVLILRMRRTQQIDFSILAALRDPVRAFLDGGGHVVICGLTPRMRRVILDSPLGQTIGPDFLLETTREVFGSAHVALSLAQSILSLAPETGRPPFRAQAEEREPSAPPRCETLDPSAAAGD